MNNKKKLNRAIKSARDENEKVSLLIKKTKIQSNEYNKIIFAYILIILEHHRSIIELTNIRQLSALALMRPLYESYIRVHWLTLRVGSKKVNKAAIQLINDVKDGAFPTLKVMCKEIDERYNLINDENNQNNFTRELEHNAEILHSYTHGGAYLISIIKNSNDKFTYKDMMMTLEHSNIQMFSAILAYASISNNIFLRENVRSIMMNY